MNITNNNINFNGYIHYVPYGTISKLKTLELPKTEDEANEYFLLVDETNQAIRPNLWDEIYALDLEQKRDLSKILSLTYKSYSPDNLYPTSILIHPKANIFKEVEDTFKTGNILDEDEIDLLRNKTKGAFTLEDIERNISLNHKESEELVENLKFIKDLLNKENYRYFEAMSPKTVIGIIQNRLLTYDDFKDALKLLKEGGIYKYASIMPKTFSERDYAIKSFIHEYLLGESYEKIEEFDYENRTHYFETNNGM